MAIAFASHTEVTAASAGATNITVTKPTGTVDGDLLLVFAFCNGAGVTFTPPAGWTTSTSGSGVHAWWKVASGEGASWTFTRSANTNSAVIQAARLTGVSPTSPVDAFSATGIVGSTTPADIPTQTVTTGVYLFQMASGVLNGTWTPPGSATEDYDVLAAAASWGVAAGHETIGPGATGTRTWTSTITGAKGGVMWSLNNNTPPGVTGDTLVTSMNRLAHTSGLTATDAANVWAGTSGLDLVHALNVKAGNALPNYRELAGVLNQLAGTTGLGVDGAAAAIAS